MTRRFFATCRANRLSLRNASFLLHLPPDGHAELRNMARILCCDRSNVRRIADQVAARGLVTVSRTWQNERSRLAELTERGKAVQSALIAALD
jgi:DNA-binding MarR family transcriptional regulator